METFIVVSLLFCCCCIVAPMGVVGIVVIFLKALGDTYFSKPKVRIALNLEALLKPNELNLLKSPEEILVEKAFFMMQILDDLPTFVKTFIVGGYAVNREFGEEIWGIPEVEEYLKTLE